MARTNKFKLSLAKRHVDNLETLGSISEDTGIEMIFYDDSVAPR